MNSEEQAALTRQICKSVVHHLSKRAESWRTNPQDPHNINTAVYVALHEVAEAFADVKATSVPSP